MAFTEDLTVFLDLNGFGVPVVAGAVSGVGILDLNSELILGGEINVIDYLLTVPTATFGGLGYGSVITVDGENYKAETAPMRFDDGAFCRVALMKITLADSAFVSRILRTGLGLVLRTGSGQILRTQPS
jgi:hypothetical protein